MCGGVLTTVALRQPGGGTMEVQQLGHVVLKVRDMDRSERFYTEVLGLPVAARLTRHP